MADHMPWLNKDKEQHARRIVALWGNSNSSSYCLFYKEQSNSSCCLWDLTYPVRDQVTWGTSLPSLSRSPMSQTHPFLWKPVNPLNASVLGSICPPSWAPDGICTACHLQDWAVCLPHKPTLVYILISVKWHCPQQSTLVSVILSALFSTSSPQAWGGPAWKENRLKITHSPWRNIANIGLSQKVQGAKMSAQCYAYVD